MFIYSPPKLENSVTATTEPSHGNNVTLCGCTIIQNDYLRVWYSDWTIHTLRILSLWTRQWKYLHDYFSNNNSCTCYFNTFYCGTIIYCSSAITTLQCSVHRYIVHTYTEHGQGRDHFHASILPRMVGAKGLCGCVGCAHIVAFVGWRTWPWSQLTSASFARSSTCTNNNSQ